MNCPKCNSSNTKCKDTRDAKGWRRRRYLCIDCNNTFGTAELYATFAKGRKGGIRNINLLERSSAQWIKKETMFGIPIARCSECGMIAPLYLDFSFCPNCGCSISEVE